MRPLPDEAHAPTRPGKAGTVRRFRALLGLLAGAAVIAVLAQTPPGSFMLRETGLVKPAPTYTSLYFSDPNTLLTKLPFGHFSVDVPFSVHNASNTTVTYQWTIQTVVGQKSTRVASGHITEAPNTTYSRNETVTGLCLSRELVIIVKLAKPAQSIDFRAVCDV